MASPPDEGHEARFAGHPVQYGRIEYAGFACRTIERSRAYDSKPRTAPWHEVLHDLVEL